MPSFKEPEPIVSFSRLLWDIDTGLQAADQSLDERDLVQCLQTKGRPNLERFWHPLIGRQLASLDFVALDTETTGLRLGWDCILELGAWRRLHKEEIRGHFHSLVNPQGPVPRAIAHLTGLDERSLTAAPGIEKPLPELLRFCKGAILVGHNLTFDWRFLAHEATRCNLPWLLEGLDLLTLARYLLSDQRRFSLALLASRLHLPLTPPHRSLADAEATALVFIRSLWLSQQSAPRSARPLSTPGQSTEQAAIRQIETSMAKKKDGDAVSSRSPRLETLPLNPAWRCTFPSQPGVYLMKDSQGQVLYVGKARCLRRRLASYYHQRSVFNPRIARLLQQVQAIETRPLGSELEALLVESQLIKELQPPYNIQLRDYAHYPFLKIDVQHAFPRLTITRQSETDGARYFGPFRSGRSVELTLELLQRLFPLPTCTRPLPPEAAPSTPCLRYHLGRCLAPCTGQLAADRYHQLIEEVSAFLAGERPELLVRVRHQMEQAAEELQYERAALLRDMLHSTEEVLISQRLINSAIATHNLLIAYPSAWEGQNELFLIRHGRLIELQRAPHEEQATRYTLRRLLARAAQLQQPPATVGQAEIDQIIIITRWIKQHSRDQAFFPFTSQTLRAPEASEELIERIWQTLSTRQGGWD